MSHHGAPAYLRSDSGPEFVSRAILQWLTDVRIETAIIDPGKPWQNGTNESFKGRFRDECLSLEWFRSRREAQVIIEAWRRHYNAVRPHSSIGYLTPFEFKQHHSSMHGGSPFKKKVRADSTGGCNTPSEPLALASPCVMCCNPDLIWQPVSDGC